MFPHRANIIRASNTNPSHSTQPESSRVLEVESMEKRGIEGDDDHEMVPAVLEALPPLELGYIYYAGGPNNEIIRVEIDKTMVGRHDERVPEKTQRTIATLHQSIKWHKRGGRDTSIFYDHNSPHYAWLLEGWVAEERSCSNGNQLKLYYGPSGKQYRSKPKVLEAWAEMGL